MTGYAGLELGVHLPLMEFGDEGQSLGRLTRAVDAARECGFAAVSANDHFLFQTPWLDGPTDAGEAKHVLRDVLAPLLGRDPDALRDQLCIGSSERCAELLSRYADAGCERVHLWPLGDEPRQIELAAALVAG